MQQVLTTEKGRDPAHQEMKDTTTGQTSKMLKMFQITVAEEVHLCALRS